MVLDAVTDYYEVILILVGINGLILGFDRITKGDEEESDLLELLGILGGLVLFATIILSIYNDEVISKYTILFSTLFSLSLLAKPFKKLPIAFAVTAVLGLAMTWYVLDRRGDEESIIGGLSLQLTIVVFIIILIVVFIIGFIQEQTMDIMLFLLSWGIVILVLSILIFLQGVTLLFEVPDKDGILGLLPG
ncbi:MAG: hypothetical protein GPJ54_14070 [Candidatus Heimdallarchaeota archaeon]|nr:hypothetical protein [Candidatus Heimdallarchaeota archaeon]